VLGTLFIINYLLQFNNMCPLDIYTYAVAYYDYSCSTSKQVRLSFKYSIIYSYLYIIFDSAISRKV